MRDQIQDLLAKATDLPYGHTRQNLVQQAINLAQTHNIRDLEYDAKLEFVESAIEASFYEKVLIHFPWLQHYADQYPEEVHEPKLLYVFEWAVVTLPYFPQIPKDKILKATEQFKQQLKKANQHPVREYKIDRLTHVCLGDLDLAAEAHENYLMVKDSGFFDSFGERSLATDTYNTAYYLEKLGAYEACFEVMSPLLMEGDTRFQTHLYARTLMLTAMPEIAGIETSARYYREAISMMTICPEDVQCYNDVLDYLVKTDNLEKAIHLFEQLCPLNESQKVPDIIMRYCFIAAFLFERIEQQMGKSISLRLPAKAPFFNDAGVYDAGKLARYFHRRGKQMMREFDDRNQNLHQTGYSTRREELRRNIIPIPLS